MEKLISHNYQLIYPNIKNSVNWLVKCNKSSNTNEGIKAVLFFKRKDFTRTKSTKTHISKRKQKRQRFFAVQKHLRGRKLLSRLFVFLCFLCAFCAFCAILSVKQKDSIFIRIKISKRKRTCCLTFCAFCTFRAFYALYAHQKHLSESPLFAFFAFCAFCTFCACEIFLFRK